MPKFFIDAPPGGSYVVGGEDGQHIARSLRMKPGETITLCDREQYDYSCVITSILPEGIQVSVGERQKCRAEPSVQVTLLQCLTKGDKFEQIVQKAVELGVHRIIPVLSARSISRPKEGAAAKKRERYQKIARSAAMQSGRGIIPQIGPFLQFDEAVLSSRRTSLIGVCYEKGGIPIGEFLKEPAQEIDLFIGPEGGFALEEITQLTDAGAHLLTLGPRILRTETAPLAAISAIMYATGNLDESGGYYESTKTCGRHP